VAIRLTAWAAVLVGLLLSAGCDMPSPQFRLNTEGRAPEEIGPARADAITEALEKLLGTPDEPNVPEGVPLKIGQLRAAAGPVGSHSDGSDLHVDQRRREAEPQGHQADAPQRRARHRHAFVCPIVAE